MLQGTGFSNQGPARGFPGVICCGGLQWDFAAHFQIMDRPSSLDGSSLPFVFDRMQLQGQIPLSLQELDDLAVKKDAPVPVDRKDAKSLKRAMPLSLDILSFD
ncbi:MAG: hypothetical protein WA419_20580 [Silvibacterium sp.]